VSDVREERLDGSRAAGGIGGVLQHHGVACHQRPRGCAEHLPEGKVPGHDCEDRTQRSRDDVAVCSLGRIGARLEHGGAVLGVVVAGQRALGDLAATLSDQLAHLAGHELGEVLLPPAEPLGERPEQCDSLRVPGAPPYLERARRGRCDRHPMLE